MRMTRGASCALTIVSLAALCSRGAHGQVPNDAAGGGNCFARGHVPAFAAKTRVYLEPVLESDSVNSAGVHQVVSYATGSVVVSRDSAAAGTPTLVPAAGPTTLRATVRICAFPEGTALPPRFAKRVPDLVL
jgi:hypothetical protein